MKTGWIVFYIVCGIIGLSVGIIAYSTYGAPTEFGNATTTTCYVGGDDGIIDCIGNITGSYFIGDGSYLNVNNSIYFQGYTPTTLGNWFQTTFGWINSITNIFNQDLNTTDDVTFNSVIATNGLSGNLNWTYLQNYPVSCPAGTYVTQINDSITCESINLETFSNNVTFEGNITQSFSTYCWDSWIDGNGTKWEMRRAC